MPKKSNEVKIVYRIVWLIAKYIVAFSLTGVLASVHAQGSISPNNNANLLSIITTLILDQETGVAGQPSLRVENYIGNSIVIWNTSSNCQGGAVTLPASATPDDRGRLYATVMAAKTGRMTMFIYYDDQPNICTIVSFGVL